MGLQTIDFQFYTYNMPSQRTDSSRMDVDNIDMAIPPPKPPRAAALCNKRNSFPDTWTTSTPIKTRASVAATAPGTATTPSKNYLIETSKSIYFGGLHGGINATKEHTTQRIWCSEMRNKLFKISHEDENLKTTNNHASEQAKVQHIPQLTPQHRIKRSSLPGEIRQKALEMSKRNSGSWETSTSAAVTKHNFAMNQSFFQKPLTNAAACEKRSLSYGKTSLPAKMEPGKNINTTFDDYFRAPPPADALDSTAEHETNLLTVKDRINFFNKLTTAHSNSFIDLLKSSKTTTPATTQHCISAQTSPLPTPLKPRRLPTQMNLSLQQDFFSNPTAQYSQAQPNNNLTQFFSPPSCNKIKYISAQSSLTSEHIKTPQSPASSVTMQRKSSLRRRASIEKSRRPIVRQNSNASTNATKAEMHSVMEDLSLVVPVKLRIAEYERLIKMKS